jgi:hypothetical protein
MENLIVKGVEVVSYHALGGHQRGDQVIHPVLCINLIEVSIRVVGDTYRHSQAADMGAPADFIKGMLGFQVKHQHMRIIIIPQGEKIAMWLNSFLKT